MSVKLRMEFDGLGDAVSLETGIFCNPAGDKAQQQFKEECDINTIARNFGLTGLLPVAARPLSYSEFDDVFDFQTAMNAVRHAGEAFMHLPSAVREKFHNSPQKFLEFCDKATIEEFHELGLTRDGFVPAVKVVEETPTT